MNNLYYNAAKKYLVDSSTAVPPGLEDAVMGAIKVYLTSKSLTANSIPDAVLTACKKYLTDNSIPFNAQGQIDDLKYLVAKTYLGLKSQPNTSDPFTTVWNALTYFGVNGAGGSQIDGDILSVTILGPGSLDNAVNNVVDGNGWIAAIKIKGKAVGAANPDCSKFTLTLSCPGYDTSGNPTNRTKTIYGTQWLRKPFPTGSAGSGTRYETTQGSDCTQYIALDDWIYAGETVTAVSVGAGFYSSSNVSNGSTSISNLSSVAVPRVKVYPVTRPWEYVTGTSVVIEYTATHAAFQDGYMIPYGLVTVTDKNGATATALAAPVSDTVLRRNDAGNPLPCYRATVDISALKDGLCFHSFSTKPWRGGAAACFNTAVDGFGPTSWTTGSTAVPHYNCPATTPFRKDVGGTYPPVYVYVAPTSSSPSGFNGNNATAVASTTPAIANALPASSVRKAQALIAAYNLANYSRNDTGNGHIRLVKGTYTGWGVAADGSIAAQGDVWCYVEADTATCTVPSDAIMLATGSTARFPPRRMRCKDIQLKAAAGEILISMDESTTTWGTGFINELDHDGCEINSNSQAGLQMWSRSGRMTAINCVSLTGGSVFWGAGASTNYKTFFASIDCCNILGTGKFSTPIMRGCASNGGTTNYPTPNIEYTMISSFATLTPLDQSAPFPYTIWIGNSVYKQGATPWRCAGGAYGHAIYNQLHEVLTGGKPMEISADTSGLVSTSEIEMGMISTPGDGNNVAYHLSPYTWNTGANAVSTTGIGSATMQVVQAAHGLTTGQNVYLYDSGSPTIGGVTYANWSGQRTVTVIDPNTFQFTASANASSVATGSSAGFQIACLNDARTIITKRVAAAVGMIGSDWNTKRDWFPSVPAGANVQDSYKVGSWPVGYHVGFKGVAIGASDANPGGLNSEFITGSNGRVVNKEIYGSNPTYVSDLSGGGGGGGNYAPLTGSSSKGRIQLANGQFGVLMPFLTDIFGNTRRLDSTGHIGAVEGAV